MSFDLSFKEIPTWDELETTYIYKVMEHFNQNKTHSAKAMGMSLRCLRIKLNESKTKIDRIQKHTGLTFMERTILDLVLENKNRDEIAKRCLIKNTTVTSHLSNIYRKLGARDRADLFFKIIKPDIVNEEKNINDLLISGIKNGF